MSHGLWLPAPANWPLLGDDVHIWRADLDRPEAEVQALQQLLAEDELSRAARFHFQKDAHRFIVGRGLLRSILSRYLDVAPSQVRFDYTAYGKPVLAPASARETISFNLAHSDRLALYAVTRDRAIGVDIEQIRPGIEHEQIAERFFSATERALLRTLPAELRAVAFFTCWTRKEAYIKAHGEGLSLPLDQFDVSFTPGEPARLVHTAGDPGEAARWSLHELHPGTGYVAALAAEGQGWRIACWYM
jgi:4'-phosphopantetheinyl transferase